MPDDDFATPIADDIRRTIGRVIEERLATKPADDADLTTLWLVLQQKRGSRR